MSMVRLERAVITVDELQSRRGEGVRLPSGWNPRGIAIDKVGS